jgi:hypothetical protein
MTERLQVGNVAMLSFRSECNRRSEFLFPDYYVTNVKKPTPEEISKYLEEIRNGEK